jgi:hypothetical protein
MELASYEFIYGVKKRWFLVFLSLIPLVMLFSNFVINYVNGLSEGFAFSHSVYYHLGKILYGMRAAGNIIEEKHREVPLQWLIIQMSYLIMISGYISEERLNRIENITRYGTYRSWWLRKVQWFIGISAMYYAIVALMLILDVKLEALVQISNGIEHIPSDLDSYGEGVYIYTVIFFILHSIILGTFQICMELRVQGIVALLVNIAIMLFEMFSQKVMLPCHLGMIIRNASVVDNPPLSMLLILIEIGVAIMGIIVSGKICKNGF